MLAVKKISEDMQAKNRTIIVGLGKTGMSCAKYLEARGESFSIIDSRINPPYLNEFKKEMPNIPCYTGEFGSKENAVLFENVQRIIISPGISINDPTIMAAKKRGAEVVGDIELFARSATAPIIGIAGSNGKSTVTSLLGQMAKTAGLNVMVGGNIGTPALDLLNHNKDIQGNDIDVPAYNILELSSFQLETTYQLNAFAAVVLNVSPDHMDRYHNFSDYVSAKQRVYQGDGAMIINRDDPSVMAMVNENITEKKQRRVVYFGLGKPAADELGIITKNEKECLAYGQQALLHVDQLKIPGRHNQANALAALALGAIMELPMLAMLEALRQFTGLPHRTQWVAELDGVNWYNDSKGTNIGATLSAIQGMPGQKILIVGGESKGADFSPLKSVLQKNNVKLVILIGRDAAIIEKALDGVVDLVHAKDMADAVSKSHDSATAGDNVMLSPACASFDMYENFEQRGDAFIQAVKSLQAVRGLVP